MRRWRWGALAGVVAGVLGLAPAALASGTTYCVNEPSCPVGGVIVGTGEGAALQEALEKAGKEPESTVLIGAGEYSRTGGFNYEGGPVTITGAGETSSILTDEAATGETVLKVKTTVAKAVAAVSRLAVDVPPEHELKGAEQAGLLLGPGAQAKLVDVVDGGGAEDVGVDIFAGASLAESAVQMPAVEAGGVGVFAFGGELSNCLVVAATAIDDVAAEGFALKGSVLAADKVGVDVGRPGLNSGKLLAEDTLVDMQQVTGSGISLNASVEKEASATLRGLTIVGGAHGVLAEATLPKGAKAGTATATALVESTVIAEVAEAAVRAEAQAREPTGTSEATAKIALRYSDTSAERFGESGESGEGHVESKVENGEGVLHKPPQFVSPMPGKGGFVSGDWRPAPGSPLIDAGNPEPLTAEESPTDLEGNPRIVHGRRDIGAYEYGFGAPTASASASPPVALTGQAITFAGSASAVEPGDTVASYQWTFDEGAVAPPGATAVHSFTRAGLHTATLTATDVLGVQTLVPVQVRVLAPVPVPVPVCNVAVCCLRGLCPRPTLPRITALTLSPSRFRALRTRASVVPVGKSGGALVTFTLSRKALVEFTPERAARGVRRGRRCVAAAHGAHGRRCTRLIPLRSFSRRATAGTHSFRFSGDLAGQALPPGHYELLAGVPGSSLSAPFTIVR